MDNLSLMALTISTGFVVDDAIVVIENITRYLEKGLLADAGGLARGAERSASPCSRSVFRWWRCSRRILLMGGIVGRLFREFAVTLSVAILVSLVVSLTTTPMMCARLLKREADQKHGGIYRATGAAFDWVLHQYERSLRWVLRHQSIVLCILLATIALNFYLVHDRAQGIFSAAGHRHARCGIAQGTQDISFQSMSHETGAIRADRQGRSGRGSMWSASPAAAAAPRPTRAGCSSRSNP